MNTETMPTPAEQAESNTAKTQALVEQDRAQEKAVLRPQRTLATPAQGPKEVFTTDDLMQGFTQEERAVLKGMFVGGAAVAMVV